jgi:hypothetical protein
MILLLIDEEHGYREWYAIVTEERYAELYENFCEMRPTLTCLTPVTDVIPEAVHEAFVTYSLNGVKHYVAGDAHVPETDLTVKHAHIHEADDSWMGNTVEEQV